MTLTVDDLVSFVSVDIINYTVDGAEILFTENPVDISNETVLYNPVIYKIVRYGTTITITCRYAQIAANASYRPVFSPGASHVPTYAKSVTYVPSYQRTGTP